MAIGAVIMAGGEGVRLRPMTLDMPKPLMPLLGEPVMGYTLKLLSRHGVSEAAATVCYLSHMVREAFGGGKNGVALSYFDEKTPLGTAGSVRRAAREAKNTFFVLSGDGLTDADLSKALAFHQKKGALATLVLKRVSVPLPYGVVMTDEAGRVTRFIEKPSWSRVFSDLVNTGVYILEKELLREIPENGRPDFGKDIFPALLKKGAPLYGFETDGYWCDIGSQRAFLTAQGDLMQGRVNLPLPEKRAMNARVSADAEIDEQSFILSGARVEAGALVEKSVIGPGAYVGAGAIVRGACMMRRSAAFPGARIEGAVLCAGAYLEEEARAMEGSALGAGAAALKAARLMPGVSVWPRLSVPEKTDVDADLTDACAEALTFVPGGARVSAPAQACRLGAALLDESTEFLLGGGMDEPMLLTLAGALSAGGAKICLAPGLPRPGCPALARARGCAALYVSGREIYLFDRAGAPYQEQALQKLIRAAGRAEPSAPTFCRGLMVTDTQAKGQYIGLLPKRAGAQGRVDVTAAEAETRALAEAIFGKAEKGAPRVLLTDGGARYALTYKGRRLPRADTALLCAKLTQENGRVHADERMPLAARARFTVLPYDESESSARQRAAMSDGFLFARLLENALETALLEDLLHDLPGAFVARRDVPCAFALKSRILGRVARDMPGAELGEGLRFKGARGDVLVRPDSARTLVTVLAEAASMEVADELCARYEKEIRDAARGER
jgi:mannose-1-phosphate guanylyltransferase/phosphomannomutase